ncbi:alkaline phosphatase [Echinicola sp. CAU 1574]|uniref:Alkaline phosphatase n=1 Tax=Echinicola arenosa TaxID=2774144 RepID=A0ABR9AFU6_9BACT|nr:alkaline phosphatase [Echinicola arenosa]MBD8487329.1 alkaline phosphatase [Echinicola arenosa]
MKINPVIGLFILLWPLVGFGQEETLFKLHSHNDYLQEVPFWTAYANNCASIEVDVILKNGRLMVAHEEESIEDGKTLESLYLEPIRQAKKLKIGPGLDFQLLVDLKTDASSTMPVLMDILGKYEDVLANGDLGVQVVVSGNRPQIEDYKNYTDLVFFDYQSTDLSTDLPWEKIALVSLPYRSLSVWNGKGRIVEEELQKLKSVITKVHEAGRPIRFWGAPDSKSAWKAFYDLGIDYINTDMPFEANQYLNSLKGNVVTSTFKPEIYYPEFKSDGVDMPIRNIVLMIGDGNGLAHISAGMYTNGNNLNLTQLRHIGLVKTQSADDFTTDSAAGATALATGQKANNRAIGFSTDGKALQNIPEILSAYNFSAGIVTTDNVTGASPAAFYAHQKDRSMIEGIASDLSKSQLDLFIGGGKNDFLTQGRDLISPLEEAGFHLAGSLEEFSTIDKGRIGYFGSNQELPTVEKGRVGFLLKATDQALSFLTKKERPFFLMIEGAKIDTGGHFNDAKTVVEEELDFDDAIGKVLQFADENPGTLVLITADHETGGVTLPQGNLERREVELNFDTHDHTGILVPLFAYGPHANEFTGVYENTVVFKKLMKLIKQYYKH